MFTVKEVIDLDGGDDMAVDDDTVGGCVSEVDRELFTTLSLECIAPNCTEMFVNQSQLDDHMLHDHSIRAFGCLLKHCDRSFGSSLRLSKHLVKAHSDVIEWNCGQCSKYYDCYDRLTKHTVEKHHRGRFGCCLSECEFVGRKRSKVNKHYKREHRVDDSDSVVLIDDDDDKEDSGRGVGEIVLKPENVQPTDQLCYITLSLECMAPNCTETFINQSQLDDHLLRVHSIRSNRCLVKECARSFGSSRRLNKHLGKAHSDVTEWHCGRCSKHYETYDRLCKHILENHHHGQFGCSLGGCKFAARKRSKVNNHYNREHQLQAKLNEDINNNVNMIVKNVESIDLFDVIAKPTKRSRTDVAQLNTDNNEHYYIIISLKCHQPNCPQMFTNKSLLLDHMLQVHSIQRNQCLFKNCNQSFNDTHTLGHHIKQAHLHITEWHCGQCPDKHYPKYKILFQHTMNYHHLGQFKCGFLGCSYPIQNNRFKVKNHYRQEHKPDYICGQPDCEYRTFSSEALKKHERAHLGIKPYRCKWPGCPFASTQASNTRIHIRNVHFNPKKTLLLGVEQLGEPMDYFEVVSELL